MYSWNSRNLILERGQATELHCKWINYADNSGRWKPIDCILKQDGSGFHTIAAPFEFHAPLNSTGVASFEVNNRYDIFKKSVITADPFSQTIKALGVNNVPGELHDINGDGRLDAVKYPDAYGAGVHLIYYVHHGRAPRLKKLIQFDSALGVDTDYEFEIIYSRKAEISSRKIPDGMTRMQHRDASEAVLNSPSPLSHDEGFYIRSHNEPQKRGIGVKTPFIWDSPTLEDVEPKKEVIDVSVRKGVGANKYILTKHIKASFFNSVIYPVFTDATYTFYPDPHIEVTSVDGRINEQDVSWAVCHSSTFALGGAIDDDVLLLARTGFESGGSYRIYRSFTLFDTSALPDGIVIDSAKLSLYVTVQENSDPDGDDFIGIVQSSPASNTALVDDDYDQCGAVISPTEGAARVDLDSISTGAYHDFPLNATGIGWIDETGISKFGWREGHDIVNSAYVGAIGTRNRIHASSADEPGFTQDPKLIIVEASVGGRKGILNFGKLGLRS